MLSEFTKHFLLLYTTVTSLIYLSYIYFKFGVLSSISDSYYKIKEKGLFTIFIWSIAFPVAILGNSFIMMLAAIFLAFVGAAPAFKEDMTEQVHVIGAIGGIILGYIGLIFQYHQLIIPAIFGILAFAIRKKKNKTWWTEIAALMGIMIELYIRNW